MIRAENLTKRYGDTTVVQDLGFTVRPGAVTGFLGPNGAGKSTTLRMILGLDAPTRGHATIDGIPYAAHTAPLTRVGALLEARSVHPGRSAYHHLMALAHTHGIPHARVERVLALAGLTGVARKRVKGSPSAWASASASPPPSSATRPPSSSTSRSTDSTRRACSGSAPSSSPWPPKAVPSSSPPTS